jgi:dTDP-4-dehydrorhamnose 3,5-epimerase-like enzyme
METYAKSEFVKQGIDVRFDQDNHSKSKVHVLRGLHYQKNLMNKQNLCVVYEGKFMMLLLKKRVKKFCDG